MKEAKTSTPISSNDKNIRSPDRPSILFVTPSTPFAQCSGTEQRSSLIYQALAQVGDVHVVQLSEGNPPQRPKRVNDAAGTLVTVQIQPNIRSLSRYSPKPGLTAELEIALGRPLESYQLIVGRYLWPICQLLIPQYVPKIVDLDDFMYRYSREVPWSVSLTAERIKKFVAHRLAKRELGRFTAAFLVSELDRVEVCGLPTQLLPNIPLSIKSNPRPSPKNMRLLFVGSLWYRPNTDGINWFLDHVWSKVLRAKPETTLTLVGPASDTTRRHWERHSNVTAPGFVTDLDAVYAEASVVVVPIHSGGGSNIKVLECLGYRRPCVASKFTAQAFGDALCAGEHLLLADTADQFADQIIDVLRYPEDYETMVDQGYHLISTQFSRAMFTENVVKLVRHVLGASHRIATEKPLA